MAHHDHHNDCGMLSDTTSSREQGPHQNSSGEKPSTPDYCIHCAWQCGALTETDHSYAVNARASGESNELAAAAWFSSVAPPVEILTTSLHPLGPSAHFPTLAGLQSVVLLI